MLNTNTSKTITKDSLRDKDHKDRSFLELDT